MNKKILIGSGVFVLIVILIGGYLFFFQKNASLTTQNPNSSPFGNPGNNSVVTPSQNTTQQGAVGDTSNTIVAKENGLRQISAAPVSDANFLAPLATTSSPTVRFIERATGNLYDANLDSGSINRVTNTTIPKIATVTWAIPGKSFLAQYIDQNTITDAVIEIGTSTATSTQTNGAENFLAVKQFELPPNIISSTFSPKGDALFYLIGGSSGIEGYLASKRGETPRLLWQFPTTEWTAQWVGTTTISLTTKPSNGISGLTYLLDTKTKTTKIALSDIHGLLTNTSPFGDKILYTEIDGKVWNTYIQDLKYKVRVPFPFGVLPEKCVWSKNELILYCARPRAVSANAPDDWYQGKISFDDTLWRFDFTSGEGSQVSSLSPSSDQAIDVVNPHLSSREDFIVFTNKKDLSLWGVPTSSQ